MIQIDIINEIVASLPTLLTSFVPGYIFTSLILWGTNRKQEITLSRTIACVIISILISGALITVVPATKNINTIQFFLLSALVSIFFGLLCGYILKLEPVNAFILNITNRSPIKDFWFEARTPKGATVYVVKGDRVYYGALMKIDEREGSSWVLLEDYSIHRGKEVERHNDWETSLAVCLEDADHVIFFYDRKEDVGVGENEE